jgi:hypothetical protein
MSSKLDQLTIGEAKELASLFCKTAPAASCAAHPFEIGANYFIRTVTHHLTGKLIEVWPTELVLIDAAWIADDGRLMDALKKGEFNEVEPFPDDVRVVIGRGSLIDAQILGNKLPRSQK